MMLAYTKNLRNRVGTGLCIMVYGISGWAHAANEQAELIEPIVCSAFDQMRSALTDDCEISSFIRPDDIDKKVRMHVKIFLEAQSKRVVVGGYRVTTENYGTYIPPIVEARPGDTVAAHLTNRLHKPVISSPHSAHGDPEENPTNLHYFHGGIVTPNNSWPMDATIGNGDNIYVYRKRGETFDFSVPIPDQLDSRVLEDAGPMLHPPGLNWYHSHLHGISSTQVNGGLSGLLSVGDAKANVKAACEKDARDQVKCNNNINEDTRYLQEHTDVKYVLLRDISLSSVSHHPRDAHGAAVATWAPQDRKAPRPQALEESLRDMCGIRREDGTIDAASPEKHEGYCERADTPTANNRIWLFTLNGQRFPKVTIRGGRNALFRMGNLSANIPYWLELECENGCDQVPVKYQVAKPSDQLEKMHIKLEVLSLDGVVPAKFSIPDEGDNPKANTFIVKDFLLMPASRVELYVRDDFAHTKQITYILKTKTLRSGGPEVWPEVRLTRIVLEPNGVESTVALALAAPVSSGPLVEPFSLSPAETPEPPPGCVKDLEPRANPAEREHRRVTFQGSDPEFQGFGYSVATEIVHFPHHLQLPPKERMAESKFVANKAKTVGTYDQQDVVQGIPFEAYDNGDGTIDWRGKKQWKGQQLKHVCIMPSLKDPKNLVGHKQLWVLVNKSDTLHNFHIHQMKFRLAKKTELLEYRIEPPASASTCGSQACDQPNYQFYDDETNPTGVEVKWHDTMPVLKNKTVFIIMSFDAKEQIGRYVYHCHILKHEDNGLMAPIEVLDADSLLELSINRE